MCRNNLSWLKFVSKGLKIPSIMKLYYIQQNNIPKCHHNSLKMAGKEVKHLAKSIITFINRYYCADRNL